MQKKVRNANEYVTSFKYLYQAVVSNHSIPLCRLYLEPTACVGQIIVYDMDINLFINGFKNIKLIF